MSVQTNGRQLRMEKGWTRRTPPKKSRGWMKGKKSETFYNQLCTLRGQYQILFDSWKKVLCQYDLNIALGGLLLMIKAKFVWSPCYCRTLWQMIFLNVLMSINCFFTNLVLFICHDRQIILLYGIPLNNRASNHRRWITY